MIPSADFKIRFGRVWKPDVFCAALFGRHAGIAMESKQAFEAPAWPEPWPSVFFDSADGKVAATVQKWAEEQGLKGTLYQGSPDVFQIIQRPEGKLLSSLEKKWGTQTEATWLKSMTGAKLSHQILEKSERKKLAEVRRLIHLWDRHDSARSALGGRRCAWFEGTWEDCAQLWPAPRSSRFKPRKPKPKGWWIEFQMEIDRKHSELVPLALTPFFTITTAKAPTIYGYSRRDEHRTWIRIRTLAPWSEETLSLAWQRKYMARALRAVFECIPGLQWCEPALKPDFSSDDSQTLKRLYGYRKLEEIPDVLRVIQDSDPEMVIPLQRRGIALWNQAKHFKAQVILFWIQQNFLSRVLKGHPCWSWFRLNQVKPWL